jgi:predicted amidohydrolase
VAIAPTLTVTALTADPGDPQATSPASFYELVCHHVEAAWEQGADVVLLPEFLWVALERWLPSLKEVSLHFWKKLWPRLQARLGQPGKCVVLGTAPWLVRDRLQNRAVMLNEGHQIIQDKRCLTPWESAFSPGTALSAWELHGWRLATLICLDVEIPEHSILLRPLQPDVLLVPSATETILGVERIARCASARSVELGCYTIVSHLTGTCASSLIDENMGRVACYTPSQAAFRKTSRLQESAVQTSGWHSLTFSLSAKSLRAMRRNRVETNPALLSPRE